MVLFLCVLYFFINFEVLGGEKGAPFRLVVSNYSMSSLDDTRSSVIAKCFCVIKVFKVLLLLPFFNVVLCQDKGADRKHKQDIQKREKLLPEEAVNKVTHNALFTTLLE